MESQAGRWLGARAEYQRVGHLGMAWLTVKEFLIGLFTWGLFLGEFDPKRFCDVIVFRRDTGSAVATLSFRRLGEATAYVENLNYRLGTEQVYDFCRDLGIGMDAVAGTGVDFDGADAPTEWVSIRARSRRPSSA